MLTLDIIILLISQESTHLTFPPKKKFEVALKVLCCNSPGLLSKESRSKCNFSWNSDIVVDLQCNKPSRYYHSGKYLQNIAKINVIWCEICVNKCKYDISRYYPIFYKKETTRFVKLFLVEVPTRPTYFAGRIRISREAIGTWAL